MEPTTPTLDYTALFTDLQTQVFNGITAVTPLAISIFAVLLSVSLGMKLFKRFTGKG